MHILDYLLEDTQQLPAVEDKALPLVQRSLRYQCRGRRAEYLMNVARLSRETLAEQAQQHQIKASMTTIHRVLLGHRVIRPELAALIVNLAKEAGITSTVDWILHGKGCLPSVNSTTLTTAQLHTQLFARFKEVYASTLELVISDNSMLPHYAPNDTVIGLRHTQQLHEFVGQTLLVELENSLTTQQNKPNILLRELAHGTQTNRYRLICHNLQSSTEPVLDNRAIQSVAPISLHYHSTQ